MSSTSPLAMGGLVSGLNTQQLVQEILAVQGLPIQSTQQQLQTVQSQDAAWMDLNTSLLTVKTDLNNLGSNLFGTLSATSSTTSVGASVNGTAQAGTYLVAANNGSLSPLAQSEEDYTSSATSAQAMTLSSSTAALGLQGTVQINGKSITLQTTNSLTDIQNAINAAGAGVTASIIQPTSQTYALVIQGNATGSQNAITYADNATYQPLTQLGLLSSSTATTAANVAVHAQDAKITVNGIAIDSPSNTVTNAIPGVTLNLTSLGTGQTATVTVAQDTQGVVNAVQTFVNDYNAAIGKINQYGGQGGTLEGQAILTGLSLNLGIPIMNTNSAAPTGFQSLSDIGVSINTTSHDGTLSLNTATLQQALQQNPSAVEQLFTGSSGLVAQLGAQLGFLTAPNTGAIPSQQQSDQQEEQMLQTEITNLQNLQQMQAQTLQNEFTAMETALSQLQAQGSAITSMMSGMSAASGASSTSGTSGSTTSSGSSSTPTVG